MSDLPDIGDLLRSSRNTRRWSLQDVAHQTRIPVETLHALEENDYTGFPSPAYAKSFLAQYSAHLEVDAADWLEAFDTGNVLANLDSYDYLKDHDEHLGEEPLPVKKERKVQKVRTPVRRAAPERAPAPASHAAVLQPLVVFAVTAALITGAVFGFLRLSDSIASSSPASNADAVAEHPTLQPLSSSPDSRPAPPQFANVARAVPASAVPVAAAPAEVLPAGVVREPLMAAHPVAQRSLSAAPDAEIATRITMDGPPPRAVIVEE